MRGRREKGTGDTENKDKERQESVMMKYKRNTDGERTEFSLRNKYIKMFWKKTMLG